MSVKRNILYVDDERDNLLAFRSIFRRHYNVTTAIGPIEAISILEKEHIDVLLTDHRMPEMTGVELCSYVKIHFPSARRIIVTGFNEKTILKEAIDTGRVERLVMKPWDTNNLKSQIESVLY